MGVRQQQQAARVKRVEPVVPVMPVVPNTAFGSNPFSIQAMVWVSMPILLVSSRFSR